DRYGPCVVEHGLGEQRVVAETELRLGGALTVRVVDLICAVHHAHSAAAAAGERLEHDGAVPRGKEGPNILDAAGSLGGGQHRYAGGNGGATRSGLVSNQLEDLGVGPHERVSGRRTRAREIGVL